MEPPCSVCPRQSVLEIYKRSEKITEFEFIHLLNLQSNGSFWEKKSDNELEDNEYSTFGFELLRNDKMLRAKKNRIQCGDDFSSGFDHLLKKQSETIKWKMPHLVLTGFKVPI